VASAVHLKVNHTGNIHLPDLLRGLLMSRLR
jgi:hypothetical protein